MSFDAVPQIFAAVDAVLGIHGVTSYVFALRRREACAVLVTVEAG